MTSTFSTTRLRVSEPFPYVFHIELALKPVNAFTEEYWIEYGRVFDSLIETGTDVRAVVVSSSLPKIFTAGIHLAALNNAVDSPQEDGARTAFSLIKVIRDFQQCIAAPLRCPFPVIVAIHGPVIGLGVDLVSACDIRYAASNTTFSIKETEIGLAADVGTLSYLPKVTGNMSLVREYAYTSENFDAATAQQMGLVSRVVQGGCKEVTKAALELAQKIANKSPVAVTGTKRILSHSVDHSIAENLEYTAIWNSAALQTKDLLDVRNAMQAKKAPQFSPLKKVLPKL